MSKPLGAFRLDKLRLRGELKAFQRLLGSGEKELSERGDILPFFKTHRNLASLVGHYNSKVLFPDLLKDEFGVLGDFACDLAVGNSINNEFTFVEFEDARPGSVFKSAGKGIPEWATRFEHGFSQIVDWFYALDDLRKTAKFRSLFGSDLADYVGVLVIGRDAHLTADMRDRLRWRSMNVPIAGKRVYCITFDELFRMLSGRVSFAT